MRFPANTDAQAGNLPNIAFVDPPYPIPDRRAARAYYNCELSADDHRDLVALLLAARCRVLVCGMPWGMYAEAFAEWTRHEFPVTLRSGRPGVEVVWTNYRDADACPLHDYRYFGDDKQQRQDLRRKVDRALARFRSMSAHERAAVLGAIAVEFEL